MKVDISPKRPPISSWTAAAPAGSGSDGGGSSIAIRSNRRMRADSLAIVAERHLGVALVLHGGLRRGGEELELLLQHRDAIGQRQRFEIGERGLQPAGHLWRAGAGEADLVEGEMDVRVPVHREHGKPNLALVVAVWRPSGSAGARAA